MLAVLHEPFDKRMFHKVGRSLVDAGHDVRYLCAAREETPPEAEGIRLVPIPMAASKRGRLLSLARLVRLGRRERAEVYIAPEPESWVAALILKALCGGRVVFDMHEHAPTEFAKFFPGPMQGMIEWLTVRAMRLFARYTDHIVLTRESFRSVWGACKTPMTVVINTNHLQAPCAEIPEALRARYAGKRVILHQGIFGDVRGSYQLLDAMRIIHAELPETHCIILGEYAYGSLDAYRAAIAQAGLAEYMELIPPVPFREVPAYIALAEVGLILFQPGLLNHTLAMPHKLFDYMREGRPVVAPDFALEVRHIVQASDCGVLVDVTQPGAIAAAVLGLLRDGGEAARLGGNGRRAVEDRYNWQQDAARLVAAVEGLDGATS